ncbi:MAG: response regulator transcription factor [Patescibacteria group bacterium]|nr:response regulator transcription factor [Patescibacteria group bacterium]
MRILVIEDQEKLATALKKGLENEGYSVDVLGDGESGQRRVEAKPRDYDAVVLDIMLPKKDGLAVCRTWRAQNINLPVLMLTAKDTLKDKVTGLDVGADDYMVKPFGHEELVARLRALLRRPRESLPTQLQAGDLTLNSATKEAYCKNRTLELTLKQFSLLEYFMRHPGQVISREQLLEHVWDFSYDAFTNIVDAHVKNLRKKLKSANYEHVLETIRGVGYRLKV